MIPYNGRTPTDSYKEFIVKLIYNNTIAQTTYTVALIAIIIFRLNKSAIWPAKSATTRNGIASESPMSPSEKGS